MKFHSRPESALKDPNTQGAVQYFNIGYSNPNEYTSHQPSIHYDSSNTSTMLQPYANNNDYTSAGEDMMRLLSKRNYVKLRR